MVKWIVVMKIQPSICLDDWGKPRKNRHRDLNPGPPECESRALPRSHLARCLQLYPNNIQLNWGLNCSWPKRKNKFSLILRFSIYYNMFIYCMLLCHSYLIFLTPLNFMIIKIKFVALQLRRTNIDWSSCCQDYREPAIIAKRYPSSLISVFLTGFRYFSINYLPKCLLIKYNVIYYFICP